MSKHLNPPPGSDEALERGCQCAVMDNHRGQGYRGTPGMYCINGSCPMHGFHLTIHNHAGSEDPHLDAAEDAARKATEHLRAAFAEMEAIRREELADAARQHDAAYAPKAPGLARGLAGMAGAFIGGAVSVAAAVLGAMVWFASSCDVPAPPAPDAQDTPDPIIQRYDVPEGQYRLRLWRNAWQ